MFRVFLAQLVLFFGAMSGGYAGGNKGGFSVLNEESKILKKKQKEEERERQRQKILEEAASAPKIGNWGDLSDEDEELDQLFKPVGDEDLTDSDAEIEDGDSPRHAAVSSDAPTAGSPSEDTESRPTAKAKGKAKDQKPGGDEDLDAVLAEFGVEIKEESKSSKKKKNKKEEKASEDQAIAQEDKSSKGKAEAKNAEAPKQPIVEEEPKQTAEEVEAAREALKKKAAAGKTSSKKGNPQALAAAEAKKAAEKAAKAKKKDKSSYDR